MDEGRQFDIFDACQLIASEAQESFGRCARSHDAGPAAGSEAEFDAEFDDEGWLPDAGRGPFGAASLLMCGASSVLGDLGALMGAATGPVSVPTLCRYVVEHVADVWWLIGVGALGPDDPRPTSEEEAVAMREAGRLQRVRRAAVRQYGWTLDFEKGRPKPVENEEEGDEGEHEGDRDEKERPAGLPRRSPEELRAILELHGLKKVGGRWSLGPDACDPTWTEKVEALAARIMPGAEAHHPGLYSFLSTSTHPNPFSVSEVGGSGEFIRTDREMARFMTIAAGAFVSGWHLLGAYARWDDKDVERVGGLLDELVQELDRLRDEAANLVGSDTG